MQADSKNLGGVRGGLCKLQRSLVGIGIAGGAIITLVANHLSAVMVATRSQCKGVRRVSEETISYGQTKVDRCKVNNYIPVTSEVTNSDIFIGRLLQPKRNDVMRPLVNTYVPHAVNGPEVLDGVRRVFTNTSR